MLAQNDAPPQKPASKRIFTPQTFHKRTRQRFARQRTVELTAHLGRALSYPEQIIVSRIIAVEWDLRRLDAKLDAGEELSGHAMRARLAAENRLRLDLVALGLQPPTAEPPDLFEQIRAEARAHQRRAAQPAATAAPQKPPAAVAASQPPGEPS